MATAAYPGWMIDCKTEVTKSKEWSTVTRELHAAIEQELTESHVAQFTDLSEAEKRLLMNRAANAIQHGDAYKSFNSKLSTFLDHYLNNYVGQQLLEEFPSESKTDLILHQVREGAFGLLRRWPEMKCKLHLCFNQNLPDRLRQMAWKLNLRNPKARSSYLEILKADPNSAMSVMDLDIIHKCEILLQAEPTFRNLSHNADILHAMKAVLSYHHARKNTQTSLVDTDYMLVIPFIVHLLTTLRPDQLVAENCRALLIEEYITFMATRPLYMKEAFNPESNAAMQTLVSTVADILERHGSKLARHMQKTFKAANNLEGQEALLEGLKSLIRPMVRCMFVGYLTLDTVLYIWDQHIIGLDTPIYDIVPTMAAVVLKLLNQTLMECSTLYGMEEALKRDASSLTKEQFMYEINKHFYQDLFTILNKDHGRLPVLDPTQIAMPWSQWNKNVIPPTLTAQDRQQAREERQSKMQRELYQRHQEEEERNRQKHEEKHQREQDEKDKQNLEKLLQQERQEREKHDRQTKQEIDALKKEIDRLKMIQQPSNQPGSLSEPSSQGRQPDSPPRTSSGDDDRGDRKGAEKTTKDMLNHFANGARSLGGQSQ
ncbi:uncharacterized protein [Amphiura filiformis]|uniref:uncharacterized protein n=1 Tax=Amphiura filiformis TaxID=82378 RepID=UPI003B2270A4